MPRKMSYEFVINPKTNKAVSIYTRLGKSIINSYLNYLSGGAAGAEGTEGLTEGVQAIRPPFLAEQRAADVWVDAGLPIDEGADMSGGSANASLVTSAVATLGYFNDLQSADAGVPFGSGLDEQITKLNKHSTPSDQDTFGCATAGGGKLININYYTGASTGSVWSRKENEKLCADGTAYSNWTQRPIIQQYCKIYDGYGGKANEPHFDLNMIVMAIGDKAIMDPLLTKHKVELKYKNGVSKQKFQTPVLHTLVVKIDDLPEEDELEPMVLSFDDVPVVLEREVDIKELTRTQKKSMRAKAMRQRALAAEEAHKRRLEVARSKKHGGASEASHPCHIFIMGPLSPASVDDIVKKISSGEVGDQFEIHVQGGNVEGAAMCSEAHPGLFPNSFNIQGSLYTWIHLEKKLDELSAGCTATRYAVGFKKEEDETPGKTLWESEEIFNEYYKNFLVNGPGNDVGGGFWDIDIDSNCDLSDALIIQDCSDKDNYSSLTWINDKLTTGIKIRTILTGAERAGIVGKGFATNLKDTAFDFLKLNFGSAHTNLNGYAIYWPAVKDSANDNYVEQKPKSGSHEIEKGLVKCFVKILRLEGVNKLNFEYGGCALGGGSPGDILFFNPLLHTDHLLLADMALHSPYIPLSAQARGGEDSLRVGKGNTPLFDTIVEEQGTLLDVAKRYKKFI